MSGPKAATVVVDPTLVLVTGAAMAAALLAVSALQTVADIAAGHAEAARLEDASQQQAVERARLATEAAARGHEALAATVAGAEAEFDRLLALADRLDAGAAVRASRPAAPATADREALVAYACRLQALHEALRSVLLTEAGLAVERLGAEPDEFLLPEALVEGARQRDPVRRLLGRVAHLGTLPPALDALAAEFDATTSAERRGLLLTELRLQVQRRLEQARAAALQAAAARVLAGSLQDLGYVVEEISETLFVEGGVVHFSRAGWGDHLVRLRVAAGGGSVNFNVVRAVDDGAQALSELDHLAEDRWCAEFPALLRALQARGLRLTVTRHLAPGELPVQQVARERLPRLATADGEAPRAARPRVRAAPPP